MLKNKRTLIVFMVLVVALVLPTTVLANKLIYRTHLHPKNELHQVVDSNAHGAAVFIYAPNGVRFLVNASNLSGDVTGIHLHGPATTAEDGPILVTLCGTPAPAVFDSCDTVNGNVILNGLIGSSIMAQWGVSGHDFRDMLDGEMVYMNVHTGLNPTGEMRGQLIPR